MTNSQLDTTNESQEVSHFTAGDHMAKINRRTQRHNKHKTEKNDPQKKYHLGTVSKNILLEGLNQFHGTNLALNADVDQDIFGKGTKHNKHDSQEVSSLPAGDQKAIVHTILRIGIIRALNESAGKLFRAATQHRQNNSSEKIVPNQKRMHTDLSKKRSNTKA